MFALLCLASTATASDTVLRLAPNAGPAVTGPTFMLTLTNVNSYMAVAAMDGSGVNGSTAGDLFLRTTQRLLISTDDGTSAAVTVDPAGNVTVAGSLSAPLFTGTVNTATNFTGSLAGDVTGSQNATQVASVGGQSAANVASGVQAANGATSANTGNAIAKRDANGGISVGSIQFADGSVLSSASLRKYFMSNSQNDASHATAQCGPGFHMASMWELVNPSALSYDTTRGYTNADSGSGPPVLSAWIRTGESAGTINIPGAANCNAWTSNSPNDYGTAVNLPFAWTYDPQFQPHYLTAPWMAAAVTCDQVRPTWCIQD